MEQTTDLCAHSSGPADTGAIAHAIASVLVPNDVLVLGGDLGAGKTTFTKALGVALDIDEPITSPTFTLHQQYEGGRLLVHHLDVYRIDQIDEVIDLALPELYENGGVVVIEWGDTITPALPSSYVLVSFEFGEGDDDRSLWIRPVGPAWTGRVTALRNNLAHHLADGPAADGHYVTDRQDG